MREYSSPDGGKASIKMKPPIGDEVTLIIHNNEYLRYSSQYYNELPAHPYMQSSCNPLDDRPEPTELIELVIKEFDIFKGLKETFDIAEARMDHYVRKLKLKGEIDFRKNVSDEWRIDQNLRFDGGMMVRMKDAAGKSQALNMMMPDRIDWSFKSNFSGKYLIGEFEVGEHLFLEGSLGKEGGCAMRFSFAF